MEKRSEQRAICWDLDETLGQFRRISSDMSGQEAPSWEEPVKVRYGVRTVLRELTKKDFLHFVTTAGTKSYAEEALTRTGLRKHFVEVYGRDVVSQRGWGKEYRCVASKLGFSDEDMKARTVVIGDAPGDQPLDIEGLVFVHLSQIYPARVASNIISRLAITGKGHFLQGFEKLYTEAPIAINEFHAQERIANFGNQILARLEYRTPSRFSNIGDLVVPTICNVIYNPHG